MVLSPINSSLEPLEEKCYSDLTRRPLTPSDFTPFPCHLTQVSFHLGRLPSQHLSASLNILGLGIPYYSIQGFISTSPSFLPFPAAGDGRACLPRAAPWSSQMPSHLLLFSSFWPHCTITSRALSTVGGFGLFIPFSQSHQCPSLFCVPHRSKSR